MKRFIRYTFYGCLCLCLTVPGNTGSAQTDFSNVPGVVIDHHPASTRNYIGSPSITILPDGSYIASHDFFGPGPKSGQSRIFRSDNHGKSWNRIAELDHQFWSTLFTHNENVYLMGTSGKYGSVIIRRSTDGGHTWTAPEDASSGLLLDGGKYHCAPQPVVKYDGRLWRGMEDAMGPGGWGTHFRSFMMSIPVDRNLLHAEHWTISERTGYNGNWLNGQFGGFLEGNAVVTPEKNLVNILRVDERTRGGRAAMIHIGNDGRSAHFDPDTGFIYFPGGSKKFTIRKDPQSTYYWSLTNWVPPVHEGGNPARTRNTVTLIRSRNLRNWEIRAVVLYHPEVKSHAFQYLDWQFDGDDIIAVSRTAFDDGSGGAHNPHDANFMTFHRFENFRKIKMNDSVIDPETLKENE